MLGLKAKQTRFEQMVGAYSSDLFRYAAWLCGDQSVAEDLVQETFARAWRSLDSLKDDAAAKGWLFTIVRRENARLHERQRPETGQIETDQLADMTRFDTSTEAFTLRRALAGLSSQYREPLILHIIGGFTTEEIASMLNLSPSAVMTRLFRARKQLRKVLDDNPAVTDRKRRA